MNITPNRVTVLDLVAQADAGKVCLPNFQRDYVWKRDQVADLLRSMVRGYFIGTFLLLASDEDRPPFQPQTVRGARTNLKQPRPQWLVLDGQQRLTSMLYAFSGADFPLRDSKEPRRFFISLRKLLEDPDDEEVVVDLKADQLGDLATRHGQYEAWMLPFTDVFKNSDFMAWRDALDDHIREHHPVDHDEYRAKVRGQWTRPITELQNFQVATIELPRVHEDDPEELGQVCAIFEKLNSTGTDLSVFDLLTARLYRSGIRLRDLWDKAVEANPRLNRWSEGKADKDKFGVLVLRVLALHRDLEIKAKALVDLKPEHFEADWSAAANAMERALELLEHVDDSGFGVFARKWMPNLALLPTLAALRWQIDQRKLGHEERNDLRRWYWSAVFLERYSSAVETVTRKDYVDLTTKWGLKGEVAEDFEPEAFRLARRTFAPTTYSIRDSATQTSSIYRGVLCMLAINGAKDWRRLEALQLQELEDHHVFPRAYLRRHKVRLSTNTIVNRTLISDETNRRITDKATAEYLASADIFPKGHGVLTAHFIDADGLAAMKEAEEGISPEAAQGAYARFLHAREAVILDRLRALVEVEAGAEFEEGEADVPDASGGLRRRIWPLPGGVKHYPKSLRHLLSLIAKGPTQDEFITQLLAEYPQVHSRTTTYGYLRVVVALGFASVVDGRTRLSPEGEAYRESGDLAMVRFALSDRILGVATLLEALAAGPRTKEELATALGDAGIIWDTDAQLNFRLRWLLGAGAIVEEDDRYQLA